MPSSRRLLVGLLIASACSSAAVEPIIDGPFSALQVAGIVTTSTGAAVGGVVLDVRARHPATCSTDFDQGQTTSSATGSFSRIVGVWGAPVDVCVWIAVLPPAGSGFAPDTITVTPARLDIDFKVLAVDIVLSELP